MEIIDAHWDELNLGVKCFEVIFSKNDSIADFLFEEEQLIHKHNAKYIVAKTPANTPHLLFELPKLSYTFVETSFELSLRKIDYTCPKFISRFDKDVSVKILNNPTDLKRIYEEISKGIFNTDRIALDSSFPSEAANNRYINWIQTLTNQGETIHEVYVANNPIGFFILKPINESKIQGILTGLYEKYSTSGYGTLIMKKLNDTVWEAGYNTYLAQVVSNNIKALRANLLFGSTIKNITYNYTKRL